MSRRPGAYSGTPLVALIPLSPWAALSPVLERGDGECGRGVRPPLQDGLPGNGKVASGSGPEVCCTVVISRSPPPWRVSARVLVDASPTLPGPWPARPGPGVHNEFPPTLKKK